MALETRQEQVQVPEERPATPTGKAEQLKSRPPAENAMVELADADLQAVSGGGSKPSVAAGSN